MSEPTQAAFDGWAIVDVLGHQRYVGYVTTAAYGQAVLFRVDVPALEERTRVTVRPGYHGASDKYLPAGTTVQEGPVPGYTKLIGAGSIYTLTPCTKDAALAAVEETQARPLMHVTLPAKAAIEAGRSLDEQQRDEDDDRHESGHEYDEEDDETVGDH